MSDSATQSRLVAQRIRNQIIEYLQAAASFEEQLNYQQAVPFVHVPSEMINHWEDWVHSDPRTTQQPDVYTADEVVALGDYHAVWLDVALRTPNPLPSIEETIALPEWLELRQAAAQALATFEVRGTFPDDHEV